MNKITALLGFLVFLLSCTPSTSTQEVEPASPHLLDDISAYTSDSLVQVVIEIPAGSNQKWEVNKQSGQTEWQKINVDSFRRVDYLPYPANYGFVPQTLLPKKDGGDGDPIDVFVIGPALPRDTIVAVHILGVIHALDRGENDSKLFAIAADGPFKNIRQLLEWENRYPGSIDIMQLWLMNYKGPAQMEISSLADEKEAASLIKKAHLAYLSER